MEPQCNDENIRSFYRNLGIDPFKTITDKGGFGSFPDLELIYPQIKDAGSIVELGAGYGRCLDYLLAKKYKGDLIAVEVNPPYVEHLRKKYEPAVRVVNQDIKTMDLGRKVDVALFLFSGIIDFSQEEQQQVVVQVARHLNPGGKMFIDVPRIGFTTYAEHKDLQHLKLENEFGKLVCYIPDNDDLEKYKKAGGFKSLGSIEYKTSRDKERTAYMLEMG